VHADKSNAKCALKEILLTSVGTATLRSYSDDITVAGEPTADICPVFEAVLDPDARLCAHRQQSCLWTRPPIGGCRPAVTVLETLTRTVLLPWDDVFFNNFHGIRAVSTLFRSCRCVSAAV